MDTDLYAANLLISCYLAVADDENLKRAAVIALVRADRTFENDRNDEAAMSYSAYALAALGKTGQAKEHMERALLIEPDNVNRRYNFACALIAPLNDRDAALAVLRPRHRANGAMRS